MTRPRVACVLGVSALAVALLGATAPAWASDSAATTSLVVRTDKGDVGGKRVDGVDSFLGIRYAAAPVGRLRWRAPQPARPWHGVATATAFGNRCPALVSTNGARSTTEDCLFVNVQRPTGDGPAGGLPVYVFIHGGGLTNGSSNQVDGAKIVRQTDAVVVSMNYRLGVFGFLGLPGLAHAVGNGNFGLMDQQAALRWVRRNIAAFGGDPARVTVGGQSAGGWSVCAHLVAPNSHRLFAQAMMQSGSCASQTEADTETAGAAYATTVGCTNEATAVTCLRAEPTGTLLDASADFAPAPTSDTSVLPEAPQDAVAAGTFARVPIVIGDNRDEGRTFAQGDIGLTQEQYEAKVRGAFGADADAILAHYPWPATSDRFTAAYVAGAVDTDAGLVAGIGGCPDLSLLNDFSRYTRTYAYEFDARHGPGLTDLQGYVWGAGHAAELPYLFPSFDNGTPIAPTFNAGERELARDMVQYWGGFVFHAHPEAQGRATWPGYNATHRIMSLRAGGRSTTISEATYRGEHQCDFWESLPSAASVRR